MKRTNLHCISQEKTITNASPMFAQTSVRPNNLIKLFLSVYCLLIFLGAPGATFGSGSIYVHKTQLDESQNQDFSFIVSTSTNGTIIEPFILNDNEAVVTPLRDLAGDVGILWAVAGGGAGADGQVFYRAGNSSVWVSAGGGATAISGIGLGDAHVQINSLGEMYFYNAGAINLVTTGAALCGAGSKIVDVTDDWVANTFALCSNGSIYRTENVFSAQAIFTQIEGAYAANNPNKNLRINTIPGTTNSLLRLRLGGDVVRSNNDGSAQVNLGNASGGAFNIGADNVAANANGEIFASRGFSVYRWEGGVNWEIEPSSRGISIIAGGPGDQVWGDALDTIRTRRVNNAATQEIQWFDDERIRTSPISGNSIMLTVVAGTYTITEGLAGGWNLQDIKVSDPSQNSPQTAADFSARRAVVVVADNETVHITFQNGRNLTNTISGNCLSANAYIETFGTGTGRGGGAQTAYHFQPNPATTIQEGEYALVPDTNATGYGATFGNFSDHTPGDTNGRMLFVNAAFESSEFFRRRFNVASGGSYTFSAYVINVTGGSGFVEPNILFEARNSSNGVIIAAQPTGNISFNAAGTWTQYSFTFLATSNQIDLILRNNQTGGAGNDVAIDDIELRIAADRGDAPNTYATLNASGGPCHIQSSQLRLGSAETVEPEGQPSLGANLDSGDEGINVFPVFIPSTSLLTTVIVRVTNNTGAAARLYGWYDFDKSGTFDADERTIVSITSIALEQTIPVIFNRTADFGAGDTYVRFRLTTDTLTLGSGASPDPAARGAATNGEVEDYRTTMFLTTAAFNKVSGRVVGFKNRGIGRATITLIGDAGQIRTTQTNSQGNFTFSDVPVGTAVITVAAKGYRFTPAQIVRNIMEDVTEIDFIGNYIAPSNR